MSGRETSANDPRQGDGGLQATRQWSYTLSRIFSALCLLATITCVGVLLGLLATVFYHGSSWFSWTLLSEFPSRIPEKAGILAGLTGSLWLIGLTALFAVPIGVGAAVYLEEFASASWWRKIIQLNIANLAGVPSIVYGILGLALFVRVITFEVAGAKLSFGLGLGRTILAGALTLTLVVLPIVILAAQEALRAVPGSIRQASHALGATKWQTVWRQVLPAATPGIMTGVILAISRALGEAAPLVAVGAVTFAAFVPKSPNEEFTALPIQIFDWASRPQPDFHNLASAAIIVLLIVLVVMNAGAVFVRYRYGKKIKW